MLGLFMLSLAAVWFVVAAAATVQLAKLRLGRLKPFVVAVAFPLILLLPVADELIGGMQLAQLCAENKVVSHPDINGRTAVNKASRKPLESLAVPVVEMAHEYHDRDDPRTLLLSFKSYQASGGLLARVLSVSQDKSPLVMNPSHCTPETPTGAWPTAAFQLRIVD